jgi:hypothetical protein
MQLGSMFINNCNNALHVSDALVVLTGYFTPSHVKHQRLSLQFLSAPEDGRKLRPKHVQRYCSY